MNLDRKMLVETLRFHSQETFECDKCPLQDILMAQNDTCEYECSKWVMSKAAQMLEDDGIIMSALVGNGFMRGDMR